jgi:hypothetical protein
MTDRREPTAPDDSALTAQVHCGRCGDPMWVAPEVAALLNDGRSQIICATCQQVIKLGLP